MLHGRMLEGGFVAFVFSSGLVGFHFLFIRHPEAGQRSAVIYSVLGSCRRHGINPAEYLQDVFERLPKAKTSEVPYLMPAAWAKAKRAAARQAN